jgi:hypothetical protein
MQRLLFALALLFACANATPANALERVSVHLVLALDCSDSVKTERWVTQLRGYSRALQNRDVIRLLSSGVGITVVIWSGADEQMQALPWVRVHDEASARALALMIERLPQPYRGYTVIGSGIDFSTRLILEADPTDSTKRIIDVSGDGQHRDSAQPDVMPGVPLETARQRAEAAGITINGLPIEGEEYQISEYYERFVIAGDGAFIETVRNPDDADAFARAIQRKLMRELLAAVR